jgi:hypothetical protein
MIGELYLFVTSTIGTMWLLWFVVELIRNLSGRPKPYGGRY